MNQTISSRQNALVRRVREAIREHADEIVIEGRKQVADAIAKGWKPIAVIADEGRPERSEALPADVTAVTSDVFRTLADTRASQGVIALFERPRASASEILARRDTVAVALDAVQDPGNVGTIVRLAAAFDAAGVLLLPGCADPYGPKAIRSSVGAILDVPVATITADELLASNVALVAADMHGRRGDPPPRGAVFVFGNEGAGVSDEIMRKADTIAIAMSSRVESLNVASSAAILLARSYALRGGL